MLSLWEVSMWLNLMVLIIASLCVGFILGWIVSRPRRWGTFGEDDPGAPGAMGGPGVPDGSDTSGGGYPTGAGFVARRS